MFRAVATFAALVLALKRAVEANEKQLKEKEQKMSAPRFLRRDDVQLRPGESLCDYCSAKCCKYFALPLETPSSRQDFDYIRWYLLHERSSVFIEGKTWYLLVHTRCGHLLDDNRCGIYHTRPNICREYSTHNCEFEDSLVYDHYFERPEQVEEYVEATLTRDKQIRGPKPALLPVI